MRNSCGVNALLIEKANLQEAAHIERVQVPNSKICYTAVCFGKQFKGDSAYNWSLSQLTYDGRRKPTGEYLAQNIEDILLDLNVKRAWAPSPVAFNAQFIDRKFLTTEIPLGSKLSLWRNKEMPADACELSPGEAFVISTGGCPIDVTTFENRMMVSHDARDCLIDRASVERPLNKSRDPESVCFTVVKELGASFYPLHLQVRVHFAIPPQLFPHPRFGKYGKFNKALAEHISQRWSKAAVLGDEENFYLNLPLLISGQYRSIGVPSDNIDIEQAYLNPHNTWIDGTPGAGRNLCVIVRHT